MPDQLPGSADTTTSTGQQAAGDQTQQTAAPATDAQPANSGEGSTQQQGSDGTDATKGGNTSQSGKPADDKPAGAPEKYEFKNAEGNTLAGESLTALADVARELNLPNESAQKIIDKVAPAIAKQQKETFDNLVGQWTADAKADKELGGDKFDENLATANAFLDSVGTLELKQLLRTSGFGNHPELIRAFYRAGKAISQDKSVQGGNAPQGNAPKDHASVLYGKQ